MQRVVVAERTATEASHERAEAVAHAHDASACAEEAEGQALEAEARAREAEVQAREIEAKANNVVADYKASPEFEQEVIEASLDAYVKGFDLCKAKMFAALNINSSKLEGIQLGDLGEEPTEEEEDGEEPGPTRP